jgi:hypothetical protein
MDLDACVPSCDCVALTPVKLRLLLVQCLMDSAMDVTKSVICSMPEFGGGGGGGGCAYGFCAVP